MKNVFVVFFLLLMAALLPAQSNEFPAVIVAGKGKVRYTSADNSLKMAVNPGQVLRNDGVLQVPNGGSVTVYCNGRIQQIRNKGAHALAEVFKPGALSSLNFDSEFGKYVRAAVETQASKHTGDGMGSATTPPKQSGDGWGTATTPPKQSGDGWGSVVTNPKQSGDGWGTATTPPKQSGDGWGTATTPPKQSGDGWGTATTPPKQSGDGMGSATTPPKQSGDGWGGQGNTIHQILPFGKIAPGLVIFSWSKPAGASGYQMVLTDASGKVVHSANTVDTFISLDMRPLGLVQDQIYTWQVKAAGKPDMAGSALGFQIGTQETQEAAVKKASNSATFKEGGPMLQSMMAAVALEKGEWFYAAQQEYEQAFKRQPKDQMLRMMYAAFWLRYGFERKAGAVAP